MKKILMTAVVVLVAGSPLAFAAANNTDTVASSRHCTSADQKSDLCRQDTHKTGGQEASGASSGRRG